MAGARKGKGEGAHEDEIRSLHGQEYPTYNKL